MATATRVSVSKFYVTSCSAAAQLWGTVNIKFGARSSEEKLYRFENDIQSSVCFWPINALG